MRVFDAAQFLLLKFATKREKNKEEMREYDGRYEEEMGRASGV